MRRRLIGEIFPVRKVSEESSREKSIRHGHISTLHLWWARRPLAASRSTIYASLVDPPENIDELSTKNSIVADLSPWECTKDGRLIKNAKDEILAANNGRRPRVLDPFGGGGSIPLEALRLGCETYTGDVNPVAILIQKCILEFPQRFGGRIKNNSISTTDADHKLLDDIQKWSDWVLVKARKDIGDFYSGSEGERVGYITARTVACQNPRCKIEIPLMRNYWLARKKKKNIAVYPYVDGDTINFKIVGDGYEPMPDTFNPSKGSISSATAVCIACGSVIDPKTLKRLFWNKKSWDKQIVTIAIAKKGKGKLYMTPSKHDLEAFKSASECLKSWSPMSKTIFSFVPDEVISTPNDSEYDLKGLYWNYTVVVLYGMTKWKDLFNPRQLLSMVVFADKIRLAHTAMLESGYDAEYAKAISTYLGIMLDRLADKNSNLVVYDVVRETIEHVFGRQALPMVWHYAELNPFSDNGWKNMRDWVMRVVRHCSAICHPATIAQKPATSLPYEDGYFDAVFTDPPYYDNIPYSVLSDFFYVWLKRSIGHLYPELFSSQYAPKADEAIADLTLARGSTKSVISKTTPDIKTKKDFENMLSASFTEIHRVLKHEGVAVIVYAHKSTEGWETLINSILESGLVITASWPIHTEMKARMVAKESAALSSSIYMVARKTSREKLGFYRDVKKSMSVHVVNKLQQLWTQDISGPDFFISAIGISLEIFAKYQRVIDDNGKPITALHLLNDVRKIVTDFAINQVLHSDFGDSITPMTRFYILWRWAYKHTKVPFDDALKLAQSVGVDIEREYNKGFVHKDGGFIKVLSPTERKIKDIEAREIIDILHKSVLLWKDGKRQIMLDELEASGMGGSDVFYKVAQAIAASVPDSDESRLLDGFLSGRGRIMTHMTMIDPNQTTL